MKGIHLVILTICLISFFSCGPKVDPELETQVQIEAYEFEQLLKTLMTHVSTWEPTMPSNMPTTDQSWVGSGKWRVNHFMTLDGLFFQVVLSVPITEEAHRKEYFESQSSGYVVSRYGWQFSRYIPLAVVVSQYEGHCNFTKLAGQLFDANPYAIETELQKHAAPDLKKLVVRLQAGILIEYAFIDKEVEVVNELEKEARLQPNVSYPYDPTIDPLLDFRRRVLHERAHWAQIESDLQKISEWDFSNLQKLREQKSR